MSNETKLASKTIHIRNKDGSNTCSPEEERLLAQTVIDQAKEIERLQSKQKRDVLGVCNAYESGFGHGQENRNLGNPYCKDDDGWQAYDYGWGEGNRRVLKDKQ